MSSTAVLDSGISGAGGGLPPITDERTPDAFGDGGDWEDWLSQLDPELAKLGMPAERVLEVGRGVTSIVENGLPKAAGHLAASAYVMPRRVGEIVRTSPGVYRLN